MKSSLKPLSSSQRNEQSSPKTRPTRRSNWNSLALPSRLCSESSMSNRLQSRSISPGPGDTDSEREDVKPKIEHQEDEIQFYSMARPIPDDFEEKKPNIKQELDLDENTLKERLRGFATFPVTLGNTLRMRTFSREFISSIFGGNMQRMCPSIGKKHLARHGRPNWMFTNNCMYQPNAPNEPGGPGLVYRSTPFAPSNGQDETIVRHLFICIKPSEWLYAGDYKRKWAEQGSKFKSAWIKVLHTEGWGARVRAMIRLRRRLNREPTEGEIETALEGKNRYEDVTVEMIEKAFRAGKQRLGISVLKCVGDDETLQRALIHEYDNLNSRPTGNMVKQEATEKKMLRRKRGVKRETE